MATYVVDPTKFQAEGVVLDWNVAGRRLGIGVAGAAAYPRTVQLRWMVNAACGLPTEPFQVWTRVHTAQAGYQALTLKQQQLMAAGTLVSWTQGSMSSIVLNVTASSAGTVMAFGGSPVLDNILALQSVAAGATTVQIAGHCINFLLVSTGITINSATGLPPGGYANSPGWTAVELVGLPVTAAAWAGVGKHGEPQGMVGALTDAPTAATQRLARGAPPFGWAPNLVAGTPAPAWAAPNSTQLVSEVNTELLNYLHDIAKNVAPAQQAAAGITVPLPPPMNSAGKYTNKPGTTTQMYPLSMTYMAASSDPFLNLALGFGTAYNAAKPPISSVAVVAAPVYDYMITAHWANGFDGKSAPVDYAAIVAPPAAAGAPATPANIGTEILGALRPPASDGDWLETVRLYWDRPVAQQLLRTASCVAARVSTSPAVAAVPLMEARPSGGYRPIVLGGVLDPPEPQDPESWRVHVMDREIDIPANPGSRALLYGAATQDIYGQWSPWTTTNTTIAQPALEPVRLSAPKLLPSVPASGSICTTTLQIDITWDWRVRSPQTITLVGRMFAASTHGSPPPNTTVATGLDRSLSGGGAAVVLNFSGDTPTAPGATVTPLTEDGETILTTFGAAQGTNRRYRVVVSGLLLDFGSTPFIGMALWAQGQERIAPNRLSPYADTATATPLVTSTGDPRPPVVPVYHVTLGSIPDAVGSSHVQISWTAQPNAAGYFIYEATEADLRSAWGVVEPGQKDTLDTRATLIHNKFADNPVRRPFHRWNAKLLTTASADITLPRGATDIHVYVVLGVSAGQVESAWPSAPNADNSIIAVAAPHIARPAAPRIEVQRVLDNSTSPPTYKASLQITSRPGPRPAMMELYRVRVDDAARELDTMGPPVARLTATSGAWNVTTAADPDYGPYISAVNGSDAPPGSWKRVWYRAAAWTARDDTRGGLPGRSDASNAAWVVLPPATGPTLSLLALSTGPTPPDVIVQWTCDAPVKRTPLGPHKISVRAAVAGAPTPLLTPLDTTLDTLPQAQPATGSGVWIVSTASGMTTYRALLRRASINDVVSFAVRITDPLGRSASQNLVIAAGSVDPPPDLNNLLLKQVTLPAPAHSVLTFTSSSPVVALPDGPYTLTVTENTGIVKQPLIATPQAPLPTLPNPTLPTPPVPIPIPVPLPRPPSISLPLGSVPTRAPLGTPPALYVVRSLAGPPYTYTVVANTTVKGFTVRITGPDGKFVEKSA